MNNERKIQNSLPWALLSQDTKMKGVMETADLFFLFLIEFLCCDFGHVGNTETQRWESIFLFPTAGFLLSDSRKNGGLGRGAGRDEIIAP